MAQNQNHRIKVRRGRNGCIIFNVTIINRETESIRNSNSTGSPNVNTPVVPTTQSGGPGGVQFAQPIVPSTQIDRVPGSVQFSQPIAPTTQIKTRKRRLKNKSSR